MICYKDMTFCPHDEDCKHAPGCARVLTEEDKRTAAAAGLNICMYGAKPICWEEEKDE